MNRPFFILVPLLVLAAPAVFSQDPTFRAAEGSKPVAPAPPVVVAPPVKDDTASAVSQMNSMERLDDTYILKKGDLVSLRIVEEDKLYSLKVQDSGNINAPFINLVPAAGHTCKNVAFYMKRELEKQHFKMATVILAVEQVAPVTKERGVAGGPASGFITIYGQVAKQGRYEVDPAEDLTVSQAILRAGGFAQFAKDKKVKVIRKYPNKRSIEIEVNLRNVMMKGKLEEDIPVRGGDVIIVGEKLINF
jgi:polysaccharide biosynthesis/export protein